MNEIRLEVIRYNNKDVIATSTTCPYTNAENVFHIRISTKTIELPNYIYAETWLITDGELEEKQCGNYPANEYDGHGVVIREGNVYHTTDGKIYYECHANHSYLDSLDD